MGYPQKIVTCCYCGTRATLVLKGRTRHELNCSSCGAPLHDLKMLPLQRQDRGEISKRRPAVARRPARPKAKKCRKRKAGVLLTKVIKVAFDAFEDIFD